MRLVLKRTAISILQDHNQLDPDKATPANLHRLPLGIKSGEHILNVQQQFDCKVHALQQQGRKGLHRSSPA